MAVNEGVDPRTGQTSALGRSLWLSIGVAATAAIACMFLPPRLAAQSLTFGGFKSGISYGNISAGSATAANQVSVAKGHFRGPGHPLDLAVADAANQTVEIWFGNGDGTFQRPTSAQIYSLPPLTSLYPAAPPAAVEATVISTTGNTQIAAADLSGTNSGYDDVVLANFQGPGTITLLKNNHTGGTFAPSLIPAVVNNNNYVTNGGGSISIAIGDFNGDGFPDLAVGNANGNYASPASFTGTISVVMNNCGGAYSFCVPVTYNAGIQTVGIAAAPLRGSNTSFEDIVATDGASVYVLLNNKVNGTTGNFPASPSQTVAINANTIQAIGGIITADINGDGYPDVIAEDQFGDNAVLINQGGANANNAGIFNSPTTSLPANFAAVTETFNSGSAYPGLVLMANGGIEYLPDNAGTFGIPVVIGPYTPSFQVGAALTAGAFDSNNDNNLDVVAVNGNEIHLVLGNGDGTFETAPSYLESAADPAELTSNSSTSITAVAVGNLHGSGAMDTVTADFGSGDTLHPNAISSLIVRLANADGTFPASGTKVIFQSSGTEPNFNSIVLGNFGGAGVKTGGSGAMDIAAVTSFGDIYVFQNDGAGNFTLSSNSPILTGFTSLAGAVVGDFRGHGGAPTDIAAIGPATNANNFNNVPQSGSVVVILGNGDGTFVSNGQGGYGTFYQGTVNTAAALATFVNPAQLAIGSLGGSNYPDIVIADSGENYPTPTGGGVWVLKNDGTGDGLFGATPLQVSSTSVQCCASQPYGPTSVALAKLFGSSFLDIVAASSPGPGQFLNVLQNSGNYTFPSSPEATYVLGGQLAIADINQDGTPDVVLWSDSVKILLNTKGYIGATSILQPWDPSYTAGPATFLSLTGPQPRVLGIGYLPNSTVPNVLIGDAQPALDILLNTGASGSSTTYTIGGTISGLGNTQSVTLLDGAGSSITLTGYNGAFTFGVPVSAGTGYNVTVSVQPSAETCTVSSGTGTVGSANVTSVAVSCQVITYAIGGAISGLGSNQSLTLSDGAGSSITLSGYNGAFAFGLSVPTGTAYNVTVSAQPSAETCTVSSGTGTVGTANVTSVAVSCQVVISEPINISDAVSVAPFSLPTPIGIAAPVAYFSVGSPLGFGGQNGTQQTLAIANVGQSGTTLELGSVTISSGAPFTLSPLACFNGATSTTIPSSGFCSLTITYTGSEPTTDTGTLLFTDNAALSDLASTPTGSSYTQSITLTGSGTVTAPPPAPPATINVPTSGPLSETISVTDAATVMACVPNVSSQFSFSHTTPFFYPNGTAQETITLTNKGVTAVTGPIYVVVNPSNLPVANKTGTTACNLPSSAYLTVSSGTLGAGQSLRFALQFIDPGHLLPSYSITTLAGSGTP